MKWLPRSQAGFVLLLLLGFGLAPGAGRAAAPALKNPAVAWESLPAIRTGVKVWAHTSKSPLNFTVMDWTNYTLQDGDGYEQALVQGGAGQLIHCWFAWLGPTPGRLRFWLRDGATPDYDLPIVDYFRTNQYPHLLWRTQDGMWWAFPCLPFEGRFKAAFTQRPNWYQYTLQLFREQRFVETITRAELEALRAKINAPPGTFPGTDPGNRTLTNALEIAAGQSRTLFAASSAGVIRRLKLTPPSAAAGALDRVHLRLTTDGAVTADLPVSMFFGGYPGAEMKNAKGLPAGFDGRALYCYFPMPFWKSMQIELVNRQDAPFAAAGEVGWSDRNPYPPASTGVFKVQYNAATPVKAGAPDFADLDVQGAGVLVGCVSRLTGEIEANFSIYTDGSKTPAIETTGGEDYFNHSYGIHPGFCTAFSGGLAPKTGYRFHILDYVPFVNSLQLLQDHGCYFTHDRDGNFLSAVFYYHTPRPFLTLTDQLDVGQPDAEAAHGYRCTGTAGKTRQQTDTSGYEGNYQEPFADDGRWTDGESGFTAAINPDNDGVRLRKRINQTAYHQEVEVFVDGASAGRWFEQGANYVLNYPHKGYREELKKHYDQRKAEIPTWQNGAMPTKFRDTEFEIPAALTKGKSQLRLRFVTKGSHAVQPADEGLANEYFYWIYSYAGVTR